MKVLMPFFLVFGIVCAPITVLADLSKCKTSGVDSVNFSFYPPELKEFGPIQATSANAVGTGGCPGTDPGVHGYGTIFTGGNKPVITSDTSSQGVGTKTMKWELVPNPEPINGKTGTYCFPRSQYKVLQKGVLAGAYLSNEDGTTYAHFTDLWHIRLKAVLTVNNTGPVSYKGRGTYYFCGCGPDKSQGTKVVCVYQRPTGNN